MRMSSEIMDSLSTSGKTVINKILLNMITIECYEKIRGPLSGPPVIDMNKIINRDIINSIPNDLPENVKSTIRYRLEYWIGKEKQQSWDNYIGRLSKRRAPKAGNKLGFCQWPGCRSKTMLELDHKFPYSLGGDEKEENIQTLCKWCNSIKGNNPLLIMQWPGESE